MNVALGPYRLYFPVAGTIVHSVEPWLGLGVAFAFRGGIGTDYYLWLPISAGCDVQLGRTSLYGGVELDVNMVNPKGVKHGPTDDHIDNLVVLARLAYRVF